MAEYLTAAPAAKRRRMFAFIKPVQRLTELLPDIVQGQPAGASWEGRQWLWYNLGANPEAAALLRKINRQLSRYVFRRQLPTNFFCFDDEPPALWTNESHPERWPAKRDVRGAVRTQYGIPITAEHAVALVLDLAEAAALDRLRRCPNCRRWFMAHRRDQQYCRGECSRESYYKAHKENWPKYQKNYRRKKKETEQYQDERRRQNAKNN